MTTAQTKRSMRASVRPGTPGRRAYSKLQPEALARALRKAQQMRAKPETHIDPQVRRHAALTALVSGGAS